MLENWANKISSKKCCHSNVNTNKWADYLCQDYSFDWEGCCSILKIFKNILQQLKKEKKQTKRRISDLARYSISRLIQQEGKQWVHSRFDMSIRHWLPGENSSKSQICDTSCVSDDLVTFIRIESFVNQKLWIKLPLQSLSHFLHKDL